MDRLKGTLALPIEATDAQALNALADNLEAHKNELSRLNRHSFWLKIAIALLIPVTLIAMWVGISGIQAIQDSNADRAARTATACVQFNNDRAQIRVTLKDMMLALVPPGIALSVEQQQAYNRISHRIDEGLKYRDCSPEGIKAYFEQQLEDPGKK